MSIKYSANFKKDYITFAVIVLFVFTFISEVFLAFYMPMKLRDSSLWDTEASLQQLTEKVDHVRSEFQKIKSSDIIIQSQASLGSDFMMEITEYIRNNRELLTLDEIHKINLMVQRFAGDLNMFNKQKKSYGKQYNVKIKNFAKKTVQSLDKIKMNMPKIIKDDDQKQPEKISNQKTNLVKNIK
ncbi:hypothetical protein AAEX28_11455 [Lentisphaerota bacterium WC36G]|nr:hypothetical protein LJT99_14290 [Lentisphaerae bacterium WC36]